ncbi:MAG: aspartyl/asparaginyl beta-hydroxylase domain-containing protein [Acidimicrobiales bacterium]|jgi:hypothetical protein
MSTTDARVDLQKRSFLQLPVEVDVDRLLEDYHSIPSEAWASTHWDQHCSSNMVLLRGGSQGTEEDFVSSDSVDHDVLNGLPYIKWLIGDSGPFGGTNHAFIFRMKPLGVARPHIDESPEWFEPFRIHIPIVTNDGAFLLSEGRSKHLPVGEVWTFNNQVKHAVLNGEAVRTHLIFDVPRRPQLVDLIERSRFDPGSDDPARWHTAGLPDKVPSITYAISSPISFAEKEALGLDPNSFASRIDEVRSIARLTRADLRVGDIVCAVNGVSECVVARTATDYIQVRHRPWEVVSLRVVRGGAEMTTRLRLYPRRIDMPQKLKERIHSKG